MKPGVKTSELWTTLGAAIVGLLVVYNVLTEEQAQAWLAVIGASILVVPVVTYGLYRTILKYRELKNLS